MDNSFTIYFFMPHEKYCNIVLTIKEPCLKFIKHIFSDLTRTIGLKWFTNLCFKLIWRIRMLCNPCCCFSIINCNHDLLYLISKVVQFELISSIQSFEYKIGLLFPINHQVHHETVVSGGDMLVE